MVKIAEPSRRSGIAAGLIAGAIALGCCVGPAAGALLGIASAATAIELATDLYSTWGWAFKLAGLAFAVAAVAVVFRRGRGCDTNGRGRRRFFAALVVSGLMTYGGLYVGTTWLGDAAAAELPEISVTGRTPKERVSSVLTQARAHYPYFTAEVKGVSSAAVRLEVGWSSPETDPATEDYDHEITRRVEESREATFVVLRAIASTNPTMHLFSAYEDQMFIPVWSRSQILGMDDPRQYRDFERYTAFLFSAADRAGYASLFQGGW